MTVTEFLKTTVPFLKGLSDEQAAQLAATAEQKPYRKGQTVIFKGVSVEGLHIVATGKVSVHVKSPTGKWLRVAELGTGDVFGEVSIVEFTMASATIKSEADDTLIFILPENTFTDILDKDPALKERTLALIHARQEKSKSATLPPAKPTPGAPQS